jgi:hypothetical protein
MPKDTYPVKKPEIIVDTSKSDPDQWEEVKDDWGGWDNEKETWGGVYSG